MRILITGINGFTGGYLKKELESHDHEVLGLTCDLLDKDQLAQEIQLAQPEGVIHLAGIAFVGCANPDSFYNINVLGTRNLLEALYFQAKNVRSILLASSANVYGNADTESVHEQIIPSPANDYAVSKLAMEYMARLWLDRLPLFIVRPFNYTGLNQSKNFLIPKIVDHYQRRAPVIELGNLDVWRDFGDVRDVVAIYRKLLEIKPHGKTINVATGKAHSLREVLSFAESITKHSLDIVINPEFARKNEVLRLTGDNSLLRSLIGEVRQVPFSETLEWMLGS